ncbi:MAG TPA: tRNA pseudouridine(55) synthase TruB [Pyrinomonadaceae bacterium]|jgi:tRNA pseudouridine55 synthase
MTDGILIVDKPAGWTSHDVVARVRRLLRERRVGHTGTLDPFATGVLVVLVGRATRLAQFLAGAEKEYEAVVRFGYATETGDLTGARRETSATEDEGAAVGDCAEFDEARIEAALACLRGEILQVPPMYSAKKVKGQKLYELARRGEEIERRAVRVVVREFVARKHEGELLRRGADGTCDMDVRVICSAGTYVRTLAESVGERLGTGAHLAALRRTRAGEFRIEDASSLDGLKELTEKESSATGDAGALAQILVSPDAALSWMPFLHLSDEEARRARHGAAVRLSSSTAADAGWTDGTHVRLRDGRGSLIAVGVYSASSAELKPRVMLATADDE